MQTHFVTEGKLFALLHQHLFLMMLTSPGKGKQTRTRVTTACSAVFALQVTAVACLRCTHTRTRTNPHTCMHRLRIQNPHKFYRLANEIPHFKFILILAQPELISCFLGADSSSTKNKKTILFLLLHFLLYRWKKQQQCNQKGATFLSHLCTISKSVSCDVKCLWEQLQPGLLLPLLSPGSSCVFTHLAHKRKLFLTPPAGFRAVTNTCGVTLGIGELIVAPFLVTHSSKGKITSKARIALTRGPYGSLPGSFPTFGDVLEIAQPSRADNVT